MIEIIPNWHPILVHFTVALVASSILFAIGSLVTNGTGSKPSLESAARWTLWLGAALTVLTVLAGYSAFGSVNHDEVSHLAMTGHRNWAIPSAIILWVAAIWSFLQYRRGSGIDIGQTLFVLVATVAVGGTALKGGDLVYRHGLGVQSLPQASGDGHDHEHADGQDHGEAIEAPDGEHDHEDEAGASGHDQGDSVAEYEMPDPAMTADAFHKALKNADVAAIERLLAANVVVLESGHAQHSREDYMAGHMKSDMAFLPDIKREVLERKASVSGNLAWVITHSHLSGHYKESEIDMASREMLMLQFNGAAWEITLVHWSDK